MGVCTISEPHYHVNANGAMKGLDYGDPNELQLLQEAQPIAIHLSILLLPIKLGLSLCSVQYHAQQRIVCNQQIFLSAMLEKSMSHLL